MSVKTRNMTKKMAVAEVVHQEPSGPSLPPSITDLPREMLEIILRNLDCGRNSMLPYRLVNPLWKSIIDDLLEKKTLNGNVDACPTLVSSDGCPKICCPGEMLLHNGNPFPSSSLTVTKRQLSYLGSYPPFRYKRHFRLDNFMSKVGSHLTTFIMKDVFLSFLGKSLAHLPNLKTLSLHCIDIPDIKDEETFGSLPALPRLSRLELYSKDSYRNNKFCAWFVGAYADQLEYLDLTLPPFGDGQFHPFPQRPSSSIKTSPMQKLRQLKLSFASAKFLQLCCSPPFLKHLYIGKLQRSEEMTLAVLMDFVDKLSNTLETLELDVKWSELSYRWNWVREGDGNKLDKILKRFYGEDDIRTGGRLSASTAGPVFPKLTKLTFPYPTNVVESAVLSKLILPKFPALRELKLGYSRQVFGRRRNLNNDEYRQSHGSTIKEFLMKEGYWRLCSKLTLVSVWHSGEEFLPLMNFDRPNFLVLSARREDDEK